MSNIKDKFKKINIWALVISILYTFFLLTGYAINKSSNMDMLFSSKYLLATISLFLVGTIVFYILINLFYHYLSKEKKEHKNLKIYDFIFEKHPLLIPFLIIFVIGLPIIFYFFPGTVQWDGMKQLDYYFGVMKWSNHHPAFSTLIMGICVKIGRALINDNFGVFIYTFLQYIFSCFTFAYIIKFFKEINVPKSIRIITLLFFILNPAWYINAYTLAKDTMYYLFFILYFIFLYKYYYNSTKKNFIILLLTSLLVILYRNNGFYIVLLTYIILFVVKRKTNFKWTLVLTGIVIVFQSIYSFILPICNITPGHIREALSVPLQQTARYVSNYDLEDDEKELIERFFHNDISIIKEKYNPELSDPIKFMFDVKDKSELMKYFNLWFKCFMKHPKVYFDSFFENYYGYYYPFKGDVKDGVAWFSIIASKRVNKGNFDFHMNEKYADERTSIENYTNMLAKTPVISLLFKTGIYTWILLLYIGYILYKKGYSLLIFSIPLLATLAFCFLSPVNSYLRYMNPLIVVLPIFIGIIMKKDVKEI